MLVPARRGRSRSAPQPAIFVFPFDVPIAGSHSIFKNLRWFRIFRLTRQPVKFGTIMHLRVFRAAVD
jgi:hypothetical protein